MKKISILILTLLVAMAACKKVPEVNKEYVDVERDLITVGTTSATIQCDYEYIATLKKAFLYYGEGEDATDMNVAEMSVVQKTLYVELAGLKENTTYSYYYEFVNGFNSMKSATKAFKTEGSPTTVTLPTVVTAEVTEITANSAKGGGEVTNDGGAEVTERGICWGTNANPTLNDSHIASGSGTGAFTAMMNGLEANTTYHVRAYAINEKGIAYGLDREFVTSGGGSGVPEGAINGLFTINENGDRVYFSQGNLQYQASTNTWRFAVNQWDFVGGPESGNVFNNGIKCDNSLISPTYDGWIDLFGWGTSGFNHGAVCYQPWSSSTNDNDYWAYGLDDANLYDHTGMADWGYNAISNGGNTPNAWRTLSQPEMWYLMDVRDTESDNRFAKGIINDNKGFLLLPDNWSNSSYYLNNTNQLEADFDSNVIPIEDWVLLESLGVVFFPVSGDRDGQVIMDLHFGTYWLSSTNPNGAVWDFAFGNHACICSTSSGHYGFSVRLVQDATSQPSIQTPTVITSDISNVTSNSAICRGDVTSDGGTEVTERGICWSVNANPTLNDSYVTAGAGTGSFTAAMNGLEANATYHVRAYATNEAGTAYGQDVEFTTLQGGGSGEHEWVDLGLPSGTLWATCNVGANSPEEYGDYFAWGETTPKTTYDWSTYKYCNGDCYQLTKYCDSVSYGYNGFTDNLTTLLPEDDAATANWGNGWRMPTLNEWNELFVNTTHTWTTQNGVKGCLFTASNGNSLFLPAAGHRYYDALYLAGICGYYWLSLLYTERPYDAWAFTLYNWGDYPIHSYDRIDGRSVRPVRSVPQI